MNEEKLRKRKSTNKKILIVFCIILVFFVAIAVFSSSNESSDDNELTLLFGELISANINEDKNIIVIKAKITSSYSNEETISQNYHNIEDLIKNQGLNEYNEIQYWAVADMSNGEESKIISFTVDSNTIQKIYDEEIVAIELGDYVSDLWIHSSLRSE